MPTLVISPKVPWVPGGVERVVKETTTRLSKKGLKIEIWCTGSKNEMQSWRGLTVKVFSSLLLSLSISTIKELKNSQEKFNIIHIHGTSNLYPLTMLIALKDWQKVVVSPHYHPTGSNLLFRILKPVYDRFIVSAYMRKVNKIICVSRTEKEILIDKFKLPRDKIEVIYNGVDIEKIRSFKSKRIPNQNEVSILYFGRLEKYKNVHMAIEALKYLPDTFVLYIVGRGPYEKELRKLTQKLGLEKRVKFLGFLPEEELYTLLHSIDVVVNLSDIEAFGIMVIESLAAGKPVIVNNKLGLKELAEYFPRSVIPIDNLTPEEVAELIKDILYKRGLKARGIRRFDWKNITRRYLQQYVDKE